MIEVGLKKKTIFIVLSFFLTAVLITGVAFGMVSKRNTEGVIHSDLDSLLRQRKTAIERYIRSMDEVAVNVYCSNWLQTLFSVKDSDIYKKEEEDDTVVEFLSTLAKFYEGAQFAVLLDDGTRLTNYGELLDYGVNIRDKKWYPKLVQNGKFTEAGCNTGICKNRSAWSMTLYYVIRNNYSLDREGVFAVTIPQQTIERYLRTDFNGAYAVLDDAKGGLIAKTFPDGYAGREKLRRKTTGIHAGDEKWHLAVYLDSSKIIVENRNIQIAFGAVILIAGLLFLLLAAVFSRYLTVPILTCKQAMKAIRDDHRGVYVENPYHDEIGELIDGFNEMSASITSLIERNKAVSYLQKETEYQMLLQQINPHFLYNTLEIINGMILGNENKNAVKLCEALGQIFKYNLRREKWVRVRDELDYIWQYLLVMKYKVRNLSVYYEVADEVLSRSILKSILQPLVENSIKHGFVRRDTCCMSIIIESRRHRIKVTVMDNGAGIGERRLTEVRAGIDRIRKSPACGMKGDAGVGIHNVFQRLYLEYGEKMRFLITSHEGAGTTIEIEYPEEEDV